jgi:hypothetical protein
MIKRKSQSEMRNDEDKKARVEIQRKKTIKKPNRSTNR